MSLKKKAGSKLSAPSESSSIDAPVASPGKRRIGVAKKYNDNVVKTTVVLPEAVHDQLVEIVFRNRKTTKESQNDLILQGIDSLIGDCGLSHMSDLNGSQRLEQVLVLLGFMGTEPKNHRSGLLQAISDFACLSRNEGLEIAAKKMIDDI